MYVFARLYRREIYEANLDYIERHNIEADRGMFTYRMGESQYTDWVSANNGHLHTYCNSSDVQQRRFEKKRKKGYEECETFSLVWIRGLYKQIELLEYFRFHENSIS